MFLTMNNEIIGSWKWPKSCPMSAIAVGRNLTWTNSMRIAVAHQTNDWYYAIIDFNEVDIKIYLPEKVIIHRGR